MQTESPRQYAEETLRRFAEDVFDRQLRAFHDHFGRIPERCEPVFFRADTDVAEPMCPQEVLSLVTAVAIDDRELSFRSIEDARVFAIHVMVHLGLPREGAEEALLETGRFRKH